MTREEFMIEKYKAFTENTLKNNMNFYTHPSTARTEPFRIADNLYYVGDKKVCTHLLDTSDGLILIDSGYLGAEHLLVDSIWRAGFDPSDIKIILHTHGHSDHFGASQEFKRMYGCELVISRIDADLVRRTNLATNLRPLATAPTFDREIEDGDTVELGNVKIRCVLTPGHTEGVMSFFFDVSYNGEIYTAGLFGGVGTNALTLPYTTKNGYDDTMPEKMLASIELLRKERVDIHLGNHPKNNNTFEKRARQLAEGGNPFIDSESFPKLLDELERKTRDIIRENAKLLEQFNSQNNKDVTFGKTEKDRNNK